MRSLSGAAGMRAVRTSLRLMLLCSLPFGLLAASQTPAKQTRGQDFVLASLREGQKVLGGSETDAAVLELEESKSSLDRDEKAKDRGEDESSPLDGGFGDFVKERLDAWHVPGLAVAVVDGKQTWTEGYGLASLPSTPVTSKTLFQTGSTTKAFLTALMGDLIANWSSGSHGDGQLTDLSWQTPLSAIITDDFVLRPEYIWAQTHLTIEDALSHRTGMPRHDKALGAHYGADGHRANMRDYARSLRHLPFVYEPRVEFRYCNYMFMIASHVLQTLTGEWIGTTMRERIWKQLGMNSTFLGMEDLRARGRVEDVAGGYYWDYKSDPNRGKEEKMDVNSDEDTTRRDKTNRFVEVPDMEYLDLASGAGGILSNVDDYAKWVRCLLKESAPVSAETHRQIKMGRMVMGAGSKKGFDQPLMYTLGWMAGTYKGHRVFTHSGGMLAFGTEVYFFPDLGYGVVTMANTANTGNLAGNEVAWKLINDKLRIPEDERWDWAADGRQTMKKQLAVPETALETLYPEHAEPPLPYALPLNSYVGTYYHPAYHNLTLDPIIDTYTQMQSPRSPRKTQRVRGKKELKAVREDVQWQMLIELAHVSGEYWVAFVEPLTTRSGLDVEVARAKFEVGVNGKVMSLVMEFFEDGTEGEVRFDKIS
ncbi:beta-lactamase/transpeptidase-like protein [Xylariaceae sp. FL0016]|nr:beta-lactamase/transpeptidase-like protein [Xylariaceae sp. FL0016]